MQILLQLVSRGHDSMLYVRNVLTFCI